jgi:GNAT superfamily N-acetyltransferase
MSLKSCLKKIGLEAHEKAIINGSVQEYRGDGYDAHEAAVEAVKDYIDQLQTERADIESQIKVASPAAAYAEINSTDDIVAKYKDQGIDIYLTDAPGAITLHTLIVPKAIRRRGVGSQVMRDVAELADKLEKRVLVTPAQRDDFHGTTSKERLVKFYKHFGFVSNKGRNKDFTISETMYRDPKKKKPPVEGRPYANVPDNLMGFGRQQSKGYWDTQYPVSLAVTVDYGSGPWRTPSAA